MDPDQNPRFEEDSKILTGLSGTERVREGSSRVDNFEKPDLIKNATVSEKVSDNQGTSSDPIAISSDEDGDEKLGNSRDDNKRYTRKEKGKEKSFLPDLNFPFNMELEVDDDDDDQEGNHEEDDDEKCRNSRDEKRRYTRREKGKEKADDLLNLPDLKLELEIDDQVSDLKLMHLSEELHLVEAAKTMDLLSSMQQCLEKKPVNQEILVEMPANQERERLALGAIRRSDYEDRKKRIKKARMFARNDSKEDHYRQKMKVNEPSKDAEITFEGFSGLFYSAVKAIQDRNTKESPEKLLQWHPNSLDVEHRLVPSLLDLSLAVLAKNADAICSLDYVPERLKLRLANLLCDTRKMDINTLELFLKGSPVEIHVKDCSWMTEAQLINTLEKSNTQNLRVLSLRGAGRLSDETLIPLLESAPLLQSINLSQCALLTCFGIKLLAAFSKNLKELYIDDCPRIGASNLMKLFTLEKKFEHLEVLSVAGIHTVSDEFVSRITTAKLKELNLANCPELMDRSLEAIGNHCPHLCALNISNLHNLTDLGLCYLANGCRSLQSFKIANNQFSDEAIAAFLETSGECLKELSLNKVRKVSFNTALSLAKCSRKLTSLDLSWCRKISNEALGLIVDSCTSLRLLKLFGCTQIGERFPYSHSNSHVRIIGLNPTLLLQHINMFEPVGDVFRYS